MSTSNVWSSVTNRYSIEGGIAEVVEHYVRQSVAVVREILQTKWWGNIICHRQISIQYWITDTYIDSVYIILDRREEYKCGFFHVPS